MRLAVLLLLAGAWAAPACADDPPKVDLKKGALFTGHAEARVVEVRSRVNGYLARVLVKDGEIVKKGDVLAEVDDRFYKAELNVAKAKLAKAQVAVKTATDNLARVRAAVEKGTEGKEALARAEAAQEEAKADVQVAEATLELAKIQLLYTTLAAPIDGRVGRILTTEGNLVRADETLLTSVVAADPIVVVFDVDERTLLAVARAVGDKGKLAVEVGLADEEGHPHKATPEALPVTIDPATGTAKFRATLPNPKGLIVHGQYLRIRLTVQPK